MIGEFNNSRNRVERSARGGFNAIWRGQVVYENGRVKKFESEDDARAISTAAIPQAGSSIEVRKERRCSRSHLAVSSNFMS